MVGTCQGQGPLPVTEEGTANSSSARGCYPAHAETPEHMSTAMLAAMHTAPWRMGANTSAIKRRPSNPRSIARVYKRLAGLTV